MELYAALDVSLDETAICVVDRGGAIVIERSWLSSSRRGGMRTCSKSSDGTSLSALALYTIGFHASPHNGAPLTIIKNSSDTFFRTLAAEQIRPKGGLLLVRRL